MSEIAFIIGFNFDSNCYLINDNILVDTGAGQNKDYLFQFFPDAKIAIHKLDAISVRNEDTLGTSMSAFEGADNSRVDIELEDGDEIADFKVIHTPGHTSGGICLWDGKNLISGDTIFAGGGVGRMDIGGNYDDMKNSVEKLTKLDVRNIYPGHGPIVENNGKEHIKMSYSLLL